MPLRGFFAVSSQDSWQSHSRFIVRILSRFLTQSSRASWQNLLSVLTESSQDSSQIPLGFFSKFFVESSWQNPLRMLDTILSGLLTEFAPDSCQNSLWIFDRVFSGLVAESSQDSYILSGFVSDAITARWINFFF